MINFKSLSTTDNKDISDPVAHRLKLVAPPFDKQKEGGVRSTLLFLGTWGNLWTCRWIYEALRINLFVWLQVGNITEDPVQMSSKDEQKKSRNTLTESKQQNI